MSPASTSRLRVRRYEPTYRSATDGLEALMSAAFCGKRAPVL
jgi:hypothetical protein